MSGVRESLRQNNVKELQNAIKSGLDINAALSQKLYPIHWTVIYGSLECLKFLLSCKVDVSVRTPQGWTAAHIAAIKGQDACIQILAKAGVNIMSRDLHGSTSLHMVCAHGHTYTLQSILRTGVDANSIDNNGWTAAHHAAFHGRLNCLQILHKWGAIMDEVDKEGNTPIHLSSCEGHLACVKFLVSCCPGGLTQVLTYRNDDGQTLRMLAERYCKDPVLQYIDGIERERELPGGQQAQNLAFPAHAAAFTGDLRALRHLIDEGVVSINERDDRLATPAHKAAGSGQASCLEWLIDRGANVRLHNEAGETPTDVARRFAQLVCVNVLEKGGGGGLDEDSEDDGSSSTVTESAHRKHSETNDNDYSEDVDGGGEDVDGGGNDVDGGSRSGDEDVKVAGEHTSPEPANHADITTATTTTSTSAADTDDDPDVALSKIRELEGLLEGARSRYTRLGGRLEGHGEVGMEASLLEQERLRKERLQSQLVRSRKEIAYLTRKLANLQRGGGDPNHTDTGRDAVDHRGRQYNKQGGVLSALHHRQQQQKHGGYTQLQHPPRHESGRGRAVRKKSSLDGGVFVTRDVVRPVQGKSKPSRIV